MLSCVVFCEQLNPNLNYKLTGSPKIYVSRSLLSLANERERITNIAVKHGHVEELREHDSTKDLLPLPDHIPSVKIDHSEGIPEYGIPGQAF